MVALKAQVKWKESPRKLAQVVLAETGAGGAGGAGRKDKRCAEAPWSTNMSLNKVQKIYKL